MINLLLNTVNLSLYIINLSLYIVNLSSQLIYCFSYMDTFSPFQSPSQLYHHAHPSNSSPKAPNPASTRQASSPPQPPTSPTQPDLAPSPTAGLAALFLDPPPSVHSALRRQSEPAPGVR